MDPLPEIRLDFNNSRPDGLLFASASRISAPLEEGDWLLAKDFEGNACRAQVAKIDSGVIYLSPDFGSWESGQALDSTTEVEGSLIVFDYASVRKRRLIRRRHTSRVTGASGQLVGVG